MAPSKFHRHIFHTSFFYSREDQAKKINICIQQFHSQFPFGDSCQTKWIGVECNNIPLDSLPDSHLVVLISFSLWAHLPCLFLWLIYGKGLIKTPLYFAVLKIYSFMPKKIKVSTPNSRSNWNIFYASSHDKEVDQQGSSFTQIVSCFICGTFV